MTFESQDIWHSHFRRVFIKQLLSAAAEGEGGVWKAGMGEAAGGKPPRVFDCAVCNLSVPYSWHGRRPKFGEQLVFVEDVYMTAKPRHLAVPLLTPRAPAAFNFLFV